MKNVWEKYLRGILFLYVFLRGLTVELASTAYRDIFINYTAGFLFVTIIVLIVNVIRKKKTAKVTEAN